MKLFLGALLLTTFTTRRALGKRINEPWRPDESSSSSGDGGGGPPPNTSDIIYETECTREEDESFGCRVICIKTTKVYEAGILINEETEGEVRNCPEPPPNTSDSVGYLTYYADDKCEKNIALLRPFQSGELVHSAIIIILCLCVCPTHRYIFFMISFHKSTQHTNTSSLLLFSLINIKLIYNVMM